MKMDSNLLLGLLVAVVIIAIIYYFNQLDTQPIQNDGVLDDDMQMYSVDETMIRETRGPLGGEPRSANKRRPVIQPPELSNRADDDIPGDLIDDLITQYSVEDRTLDGGSGDFSPADPMSETHAPFDNYGRKRQLNMRKMEEPYSSDVYDHRQPSYMEKRMIKKSPLDREQDDRYVENDPRDFTYKKNKFTQRTQQDIDDLFDVDKMLPQERKDWFDVTPLESTKKIKGTHLIHPKTHMGVNTVANSLRNATHDIRGDIVNPKLNTGPWNQSTIEPDTNIKGICNAV